MTKEVDILSHQFVRGVMQATLPAIARGKHPVGSKAEIAAIRDANQRSLSLAESYGFEVIRTVHPLLGTFERIETAHRLLLKSPTRLGRAPWQMSRDEWIDYHFGVMTVALASLVDLHLVLVAAVCQLGLPFRHCRFDIVTEHQFVPNSVSRALKNLRDRSKVHTERRHALVHRGTRADVGDLTDPEFIDHLRGLGLIARANPDDELVAGLPFYWRIALSSLKPKLIEAVDVAVSASSVVLDSVLGEWERRHAMFIAASTRHKIDAV